MNPKNLIMISAMALAISIGTLLQNEEANAGSAALCPAEAAGSEVAVRDELRQALGAESDEEIYDALYDGLTLADIAEKNGKDIEPVIDLQVAQLSEQLEQRLASGSLTPERYEAHRAELRDIISMSAYGR